jgi:hypothetical protein
VQPVDRHQCSKKKKKEPDRLEFKENKKKEGSHDLDRSNQIEWY